MDRTGQGGEFPEDPPRTELERRIERGEEPRAILEELCRNIQPQLYRFAYRKLGNVHDAYDVVQTVFLKMQLNLATMIRREPVEAWIFTVAGHEVANRYRQAKRELPTEAESLERDPAEESQAEPFEEDVENWVGHTRAVLAYLRTTVAAGWIRPRDLDAYWLGTGEQVRQRDVAEIVGLSQPRVSQLKSEVERKVRIALYLGDILGVVRAPYREAAIRSHLELLDLSVRLTPRDRELLRCAGAEVRLDGLGQFVLWPKDAEIAIQALTDPEPALHDLHDAESAYAGAIPNPTPRCIESPCAVHTAARTRRRRKDDE
jgi:RNA polymerase sigma factor (sigma-70 family)